MGTNIRVYFLAKELRSLGYEIDLYAFRNFLSIYDDFDEMNCHEKLVNSLYLYDYRETVLFRKRHKIHRYISQVLHNEELENWVTPSMVKQFNEITSSIEYDYIIMFYAYTAELISPGNYRGSSSKIYFMEDLLSVAHFVSGRSKYIGGLLDSEIKRISYFDKIVCISSDEKILFEKLLPNKQFYFLPHLISKKNVTGKLVNKVMKVLFIGYDNEYNIEGMRWFFENVYSHILVDIELIVVGKVTKYIDGSYPNLRKIEYVENLRELYLNVDMVICPLQNGTGMKIKVVEAMSYGIPIVCTSRGVDGLPDKNRNGCLVSDTPEGFADAINRLATNTALYKECQMKINEYFSEILDWAVYKEMLPKLFD
ncbi:MAG: glycosyltransferase family 4 protein, partial [Bacteroides acidifaciens]|nr:glycosyltransferase family 4 protein [Bacteroides acidifaciens]